MTGLRPQRPALIFFQEIKPGDVRKQRAESNDATSGGGARDLRIRPAEKFTPILANMFPEEGSEEDVLQGSVHWLDERDQVQAATIELWRPTEARPGEARIGRIHLIDSWHVDEAAYNADRGRGLKWFYLLVRDIKGVTWARLLYEENLPNEISEVRRYVTERISQTHQSRAVRGTINFETGEEYP